MRSQWISTPAPGQDLGPVLGEDITNLSVTELEHRIEALKQEITRVEQELSTKRASQAAAENIFKS